MAYGEWNGHVTDDNQSNQSNVSLIQQLSDRIISCYASKNTRWKSEYSQYSQ